MRGTIILLPALAFAAAANAGDVFKIAEGGRAAAVVCVPAAPSPSVAYAAKELAGYLGKITGAAFGVVTGAADAAAIRVGDAYESARPEEIRIEARDAKTLVVTGEGPRGPLYAVYALLERLGCGFWAPDNETVPAAPDLSVPVGLDVTDAPCFEVRQPHGESAFSHPEWKVKIGVNADMYVPNLAPELGGRRQYDLGQWAAGLTAEAKAVDGEHGESNFARHPEWFAWRAATKGRSPQQLCFSDPGCRAELVRRVREIMRKEPDRRQISISVGDGGDFCQCERCEAIVRREGGRIGPELDGANYVARELAAEFPRLRFLTFAYEATMRPPNTLRPEPNVDICFAYIQRNYARPPAETRGHNERLARWSELCHTNVYIWGYNAQFKDFHVPWPIIGTMGPEMRTYRDFGVKGVYMQMGEGEYSDFVDLRCWLCAKLLWNPDQDEWKLMGKWCDGACGKGAPFVMRWLRLREKVRVRVKSLGLYQGDTRGVFNPEEILEGDRLLAQALEATAGDPRTSAQIRRLRHSVRHTMLVRYHADIAAAAAAGGFALPSRAALLKELKADNNGCWSEGCGWFGAFLPRIRHGEVQPEKPGDGPRTRGEWTFRNPVLFGRAADAFVTYDPKTARYYGLWNAGDSIVLRRAARAVDLFAEGCDELSAWTRDGAAPAKAPAPDPLDDAFGDLDDLDGLGDAKALALDDAEGFSSGLRGPELHRGADGVWRIYACDGSRLLVLRGQKDDPFSKYEFKGFLLPGENAVDPTVCTLPNGKTYLCYAGTPGNPGLKLRELVTPETAGPKEYVLFATRRPGEAPLSPSFFRAGGALYLLYGIGGRESADSEVCALRYASGNPTAPKSWEPCEGPVLRSGNAFHNENTVLCGPRAPSVFTSADGSENWVVFRGWTSRRPVDDEGDAILCMQRLDDGMDPGSVLLDGGAELRILLIQPSGDFDQTPAPAAQANKD